MNVQKAMARALITPLAVLGVAAIAPTSASAATTTDSLQGEFLSSLPPAQTTGGNCDPATESTLMFEASGVATGPYPGTFTETGSATFGPSIYEIPSAPGQYRAEVLAFSADFTITGLFGTVTGHKELAPGGGQTIDTGNAASCLSAGSGIAGINTFNLVYTAQTPAGDDMGTSAVNMNTYPDPIANSPQAQFREWFYSANPSTLPPQCSDGVDNDGDGAIDYPSDPGCTSLADDSESPNPAPPGPATVVVTPATAVNPVGTSHTITATVDNNSGTPVSGAAVLVSVSGSSTTSGTCTTDSAGQCSYTYTGPALPGADAITACADSNSSGTVDTGEPCGTATKTWVLPVSTTGTVTGVGLTANTTHTGSIAIAFTATSNRRGVQGDCLVVDLSTRTTIRCLDVTALVKSGNHATFFGHATVNGVATVYRIDVVDNGSPGRGRDAFTIQAGTGYTAGGVLTAGDIVVR